MKRPPDAGEIAPRDGQGFLERSTHILALSSLTVAQPLLDLLSQNHEFFVIRGFDGLGIVALVVSLFLVIPLPFIAIEALLFRAPCRIQESVHLLFIWVFCTVLALLFLKRFEAPPAVLMIVLASLLGAFATLAYRRVRVARSFVGLLAIGLVAIPALFFLNPQVSRLLTRRQSGVVDLPTLKTRTPIVFVLFDEFSLPVLLDADLRINRHRYPNFAALADRSTWYSRAVTAAESTASAVPAILTAIAPKMDQVPSLADHPNNLFTLFGGSHDLWVDEPITRLCPEELNRKEVVGGDRWVRYAGLASDLRVVYLHLVLPAAWGYRLPAISSGWSDFALGGDERAAPPDDGKAEPKGFFKPALRAVRRDRRPGFDQFVDLASEASSSQLFFIHLALPHRPWDLLPDGRRYPTDGKGGPMRRSGWSEDRFLPSQGLQRYILQTMYVDSVIGRLIDGLEANGLFDDAMIVLVADHGLSFTPGEHQRLVSEVNANEVLHVPLLIKAPRQKEGRVVGRRVSTLDVLPTILDILGERPPWPMDGVSRLRNRGSKKLPLQFFSNKRGVVELDLPVSGGLKKSVNNKLRLFGDGSDPESIFSFGPNPRLLGRPIGDIDIVDGRSGRAKIGNADAYRDVDLKGPDLPALLYGSVRRPKSDESGQKIAVALNGVVVATTVTERSERRWQQFTALLPPAAFRQAENTIELFRIVPRRGNPALMRLALK